MATFANRRNNYCSNINQNNATINNIDEFMFNNPAYTTHNINLMKFADLSNPPIPKIFQKRVLADTTTERFISTIFTNDKILLEFSDLVYHTLNKYIMTNINVLLLSENQPILDMNNEYVLVMFKGGNILHIYYNFLENIIASLNPAIFQETQTIYGQSKKYFKISDCDFNLYIISESSHRYNLLYSYAIPLVINALKELQDFFEQQFINEYNPAKAGQVSQPLGLVYTIEPNLQDCLQISDISKLDKFITNNIFLNMGLQNPLPQEYIDGIALFRRALEYRYNRNAYVLYHVINYLVVLDNYSILEDIPDNQHKRRLVNEIFGNFPTHQEFVNRITDKKTLLNVSINIKKDKLIGFYTYDKINALIHNVIEKVHERGNDGISNHIVEYRNNLNIKKQNMFYGQIFMKEYSFTNFTANANPEIFQSDTPIMRKEQLKPKKRNSMIIFPNYGLKNIDLLTVKENNVPIEHHNYLTMSFIKSGFKNSMFNIAFALLRIKWNLSYENENGGLNIVKKIYEVNPNGTTGQEILQQPSAQSTPPEQPMQPMQPTLPNNDVFHMPSELIDLGISHYADYNYGHLLHNLENIESVFSCISINPDKQDFIIGYSLNYLGFDIYQILWEQTTMPWTDLKFAKRLDRFFMVILYDAIRNELLSKNRQQVAEDTPQNYRIYNTISRDLIELMDGRANNYNAIGGQQAYRDLLNGQIIKYFKFPALINVNILLKLNENQFNYLLIPNTTYSKLGIFITTILHFIYNLFIIEYFTPEEIYDFYFACSIRNNFYVNDNLKQYLGKDVNDNIINRPRNPDDLDIIKDINKYLINYTQSLKKWVDFFSSIVSSQVNDQAQYNRLLGVAQQQISNISGGSKTKKHRNKKTLKTSNKKTLINRNRMSHIGGKLSPTPTDNPTPIEQLIPPTTDKQTTRNQSADKKEKAPLEVKIENVPKKITEGLSILEDFKFVNVVYDNFILFDSEVSKKYKTINLQASFENNMTDMADIF